MPTKLASWQLSAFNGPPLSLLPYLRPVDACMPHVATYFSIAHNRPIKYLPSNSPYIIQCVRYSWEQHHLWPKSGILAIHRSAVTLPVKLWSLKCQQTSWPTPVSLLSANEHKFWYQVQNLVLNFPRVSLPLSWVLAPLAAAICAVIYGVWSRSTANSYGTISLQYI